MNWGRAFRLGSAVVSMTRDPNIHLLARGAWGGMKRLRSMVSKKSKASDNDASEDKVKSTSHAAKPSRQGAKREQRRVRPADAARHETRGKGSSNAKPTSRH